MFRFCQTSPKSGLLCGPSSFKVPERDAFAVPVAGLAVDGGGVLAGGDRLVEPPHLAQGGAEVVQRHALAAPVAGLAADGGGVLAGGDRLVEPPCLAQGGAEVVQRRALAVPVAEAPGSVQADGGGGQPVVEPPPGQVLAQHQGKAKCGLV